jgi:hypothetical protein
VIGPGGNAAPIPPERIVAFRPRTILTAAALIVGVAIVLWVVGVSRRVLVWALVSVFLALALNPAVEALQLRGLRQRAAAAAVVYLLAIATIAGIGALIVPQVNDLVDAALGCVRTSPRAAGRSGSSRPGTTSSSGCRTPSRVTAARAGWREERAQRST